MILNSKVVASLNYYSFLSQATATGYPGSPTLLVIDACIFSHVLINCCCCIVFIAMATLELSLFVS